LPATTRNGWLPLIDEGWDEFILPPPDGCLTTMRSYTGGKPPGTTELPSPEKRFILSKPESSFPKTSRVVSLAPYWYEDDHAIYVHAGLPQGANGFMHSSEVKAKVGSFGFATEFLRELSGKARRLRAHAYRSTCRPSCRAILLKIRPMCGPESASSYRHRVRQWRLSNGRRAPGGQRLRIPMRDARANAPLISVRQEPSSRGFLGSGLLGFRWRLSRHAIGTGGRESAEAIGTLLTQATTPWSHCTWQALGRHSVRCSQ